VYVYIYIYIYISTYIYIYIYMYMTGETGGIDGSAEQEKERPIFSRFQAQLSIFFLSAWQDGLVIPASRATHQKRDFGVI